MLALLGMVALFSPPPSEVFLDVPLYIAADVEAPVLQAALAEVETIFEPGGIRLRFDIVRDDGPAPTHPLVTVIVLPRPARFIVHGCRRGRHDHRLGHTQLQSRRVTLWSEQIARAVDGNWDRADVPEVNDGMFARAMGRVLAHELGHLFLRLYGHRENGLMRPSFSHRSLTSRSARAFRLSTRDLKAIRESLERATAPD